MKNNHRLTTIEKILKEQQATNRRLDGSIEELKAMNRRMNGSIAELKNLQWEFAKAMIKVNEKLVKVEEDLLKVNQRLDAHMAKMDKFMEHSERRFQLFYDRLVKLEHKNGKRG